MAPQDLSSARFWLLLPLVAASLFYLFLVSPAALLVKHSERSTNQNQILLSHVSQRHVDVNHADYLDLDKSLYRSGNLSQLVRRDGGDDTCVKGIPCKTAACCGSFLGTDTGVCGFGPTFCGTDCDSQCDAKPECGQFADPAGNKYFTPLLAEQTDFMFF
jgi:hypothetical protein